MKEGFRRARRETQLFFAASRYVSEGGVDLLFIQATSALFHSFERFLLKHGYIERNGIDHLKRSVPVFKDLNCLTHASPRSKIELAMKEARIVSERNKSLPYFVASYEAQMENLERISRARMFRGITSWKKQVSRLWTTRQVK